MKQNKNKNLIIAKEIKKNVKEIYQIIKEAESINLYYKDNLKSFDIDYLITPKDIKMFNFISKYLFKSLKFRDFNIFFRLKNKKIICKQDQSKSRLSINEIEKNKYIIPKFINFCLFYHNKLSDNLNISSPYFIDNILKLVKILFMNDFLKEQDLQMIIFIQIILCLYKNNEKSENIQNIKQIYLIIDYLVSFCSNNNYYMREFKLKQFNAIVNYFISIINENILVNNNFINKYLLAENKSFFNLINLSKITFYTTTYKIIKILVNIYIYQISSDYIFNGCSEQFLYRIHKETLLNKTNLLMAKNAFINDLLEKEKNLFKKDDLFIKNGFYFIDSAYNGIVCESNNKFPNENDGYSIVVSFRFMNNNKNQENDNRIYTIFSIMNKDNYLFHLYIEENILKLKVKKEKKPFDLFQIDNLCNYVLWIIQNRSKKHKMILLLNNKKLIINSIYYPEGNFKINLGFSNCNNTNSISKDNFVGIIGTFILFRKCLVKDENDNINITRLTELKGNYEDIIYVNSKREWSFIDKNLNWILNKMSKDIDIYKDIDIIISTKSLGGLDLLNDVNIMPEELQNEILCNYFYNSSSSKNDVKFYFRNKNNLKEKLNLHLNLNFSFIDFLNNHIFLYLQLELYYFLSLISFKLSKFKEEKNANIKKFKIFENANDEEDFYLNISKICSLFFFFIDLINSNSIFINNSQEKIIKTEIDNFKNTLIDLVSIYSKYNCKMKTYFLSLFVEKINDKKYSEYCFFILDIEFYDFKNNEVFDILFNYLNHISVDYCDNEQIKKVFLKMIDFDKIYISDDIKKQTKKEYSRLMRLLIKLCIDQNIKECIKSFRKKIKKLKDDFEKNNIYSLNNSDSNIQEEEDNNELDIKKEKLSFDITNNMNNYDNNLKKTLFRKTLNLQNKINDESNNNSKNELNNSQNNLELLILIYKNLKNLYIGINTVKKKFLEICNYKNNSISELFNNLFIDICKIYPIEEDEQFIKFESSEKGKKELIVAELIKSLCIRFLDDLYFEENIKIIKEEEAKNGEKNEDRKGSSGSLKKSFNSCKTQIITNNNKSNKNSFKKDNSSNNLKNLLNPTNYSKQGSFISITNNQKNLTVEGILTSKMEFFDKIILSQYTFKSFYLSLFRDLSNDKKMKIIKSDIIIEKNKTLLLTEKYFPKTRYLLRIIISLFEKQNLDGYDTVFMSKIQLIEYSYKVFIGLLKNMLEHYLKSDLEKKKKLKPMINSIFVDKGQYYSAYSFYKIMLDDIINNFNFNGCSNTKQNYDLIYNYLDQILEKIRKDINEFITNTLYELIDPFYFKLLIEQYFEVDKNDEYILKTVTMIIELIIKKMNKENKNRIIEINCKNIIILLYKMIFYVNKRNLILNSENKLFLNQVILFLSEFIDHCNILYTKILFPIEENRGKLLIEILFEIILEMYFDYLRNPKIESLQVSFYIFKNLFDEKKIKVNLAGHIKHRDSKSKNSEKKEIYSPFYIIDKLSYFQNNNNSNENVRISDNISISKQFYELRNYILYSKYKDELKEDKDLFSTCILFCIKIIISINDLEEYYKNNKRNSNIGLTQTPISYADAEIKCETSYEPGTVDMFIEELKTQFINLCNNILIIHIEHTSSNPFKSIGYYARNLYEYFRSFIVDKLSFKEDESNIKIDELIKNLNKFKSDIKYFERVIFTKDGRTKLYTDKNFNQILKNLIKNEMVIKDNDSVGSINEIKSRNSSEGRNSIKFCKISKSVKNSFINNDIKIGFTNSVKSLKKIENGGLYLNNETSKSENLLFLKRNIQSNKSIYINKILYNIKLKFTKDLIRTYFSSYFKKLLTYDEDFINMKNLYNITYNKEIKGIDNYGILYPTRLKNYITNNYNKIFFKRDFDFFTNGYFKYTHNYLYNKNNKFNYIFQDKLLFPDKKLIEENDNLNKDISKQLNELIIYECEMITVKGSIFGNIYVFENCLLFKSELENDKRVTDFKSKNIEDNFLDYACSSIEYDHLKKEKKIIMEYNNIKEIVNRTFFYSWTSLEIFLKDGKSFLFNLFNEETNDDMLEFLKLIKKIPVIKKNSEYFKKEEYSKKWREDKISTFDYLLLLNKFSSRTFNDPNQYPIIPWIFLENGTYDIRDFDLPISVQDEDKKEHFLSKKDNFIDTENIITHGNHYSTSAYICFYLMRINPFTNNMIKFQSNSFDIPDRQYSDMQQTIFLCQKMNNNRELIPELFSIPEIYINLNDNDFGKQKGGTRVHNITFKPYSDNAFEFSYLIKDLINNNIEINNEINKWFDFIFGINQLGNYSSNKYLKNEDKEKLKSLRRFNSYCYGQKFNFKKLIIEAQKHNKSQKDLYDDIKMNINIAINFGQCPYQLFNEPHPNKSKHYNNNDNCNILTKTSSDNIIFDSNINLRYNSIYSSKSNKEQYITPMNKKSFEDICKVKNAGEILYFRKSSNNNYLYCLLNNRIIEIYKFEIKKNAFVSVKSIKPKNVFLFLRKSKNNNNLIFRPKYIFCEFNENVFIYCRTLDKALVYYNVIENIEIPFILKSFTTCIIRINNNEFITGHGNGGICKWKINYAEKDRGVELELLLLIKSNKKFITCLAYNPKINIIISCDYNTIIIRKYYDFEILSSIDIKNEENYKKYIVDVKVGDYNFLYALIYIEDMEAYELQGFTLNGTYFGKYRGDISNFEISKSGKIIIGEINNPTIKVLHPVKLNEINLETNLEPKGENNYYHFDLEKPNIIYYGVRDKESSRIKIIALDPENVKKF